VQLQPSLLVYHLIVVLFVQYHLLIVAKLQRKELIQKMILQTYNQSTTDDNVGYIDKPIVHLSCLETKPTKSHLLADALVQLPTKSSEGL